VAVVTLAYPLAVYLALDRFEPRAFALLLVVLALIRGWATRQPLWIVVGAAALMLGVAAALADDWLPIKLYPVLVNGALLALFAISLVRPPSAIERLARLSEPELPAAAVVYTRTVTQVWCGFFALNGAVAFATALWASPEVWVLYNGVVAYALMGLLFGAEWVVRQRVRARHRAAHG